jgi:hypothetical protein
MTRLHDVSQLTTAELETARRHLRANLGLITPGSPAHAPILAHMQAIDAAAGTTAVPAGNVRGPACPLPPGARALPPALPGGLAAVPEMRGCMLI